MVTVQQLDSGRNNNFDLIRFIAATMVVFSHSFWLTGNEMNEPLGKLCGLLTFGSLGVKLFFAISGYLITKSLFRQPTLSSFVWARTLRIFPGLIATALFCGLVIGPICTTVPLNSYFNNKALYAFLWRLPILHNFPNALPGVFLSAPIPNNINSPLWTLPGELLMYLCVLLLGAIMLVWKEHRKSIAVLPLLIVVGLYFWGIPYPADYMKNVVSWGLLFFLGMLSYFFRSKISLNIPVLIGMAIAFLMLFHFRFRFRDEAFDVVLMYAILIFAYHPKLQIKNFHKLGDLSYGLYIYALPIQQLVIQKTALLNPLTHFFVSYIIAFPIAALSWYFIEKPMLRLKNLKL